MRLENITSRNKEFLEKMLLEFLSSINEADDRIDDV
mgnify:CR=1 FL=1